MKSLVKILPVFLMLFALISCTQKDFNSVVVESSLIVKDNLYGNGDEGINEENFHITDQSSWDELMEKVNSVNTETDKFEETDIDFTNFDVIAVFDQIRPSAAYSIELAITDDTEHINVEITKIVPEPGAIVATVITQPYHIVKIDKQELDVAFN